MGDELCDQPVATEEVVRVGRLEARQALERADALGCHTSGGRRPLEHAGLLAHELQVDHLSCELGLDLPQVASVRRRSRCDVREQPARLVDGDGHRGPRELAAGRVALLGILGERAGDDRVEGRRKLRPLGAERRRLPLEVREHDRDVRLALEGRLAGEAFVEHAAERVDVGAPVHVLAGDLLGGDVVDRPHEVAVVAGPALVGESLREAEVREVGVVRAVEAGAGVEQHVGGLHVAMDEATRMRGVESARHLGEDPDRFPRLERAVPQPLLEVRTLHVAHGDEEQLAELSGLVDRDDVRVVDRGRELGLPQEALAEGRVLGQVGGEELERDVASQADVLGEVDDTHTTATEQGLDPVPRELSADSRVVAHPHVRILAFGGLSERYALVCDES